MKKNVKQISDPDDLNRVLQYSSPVTWIVLGAIVVVLLAFFSWASLYKLDVKVVGKADITDHTVTLHADESYKNKIEVGTRVYISDKEGEIISFADGEPVVSTFDLDDGEYEYTFVLEKAKPIEFLFGTIS